MEEGRSASAKTIPGSVQLPAAPAVLLFLCLLSPLAAFRGVGRAGVTATRAAAKPGGQSAAGGSRQKLDAAGLLL